jgi:serine protease Do
MGRTASRAIGVVVLAALVIPPALPAAAQSAPASFADLSARLLPSVVNISTTQTIKRGEGPSAQRPQLPPGSPFEDFFREFFDRQQRRGTPSRRATSLGSGFIIDAAGYVVTNNHVIAEADEITVTLADDRRLEAKVVGRDAKTDLALLKVESDTPLRAVAFGDSRGTRVGDWVVAIGNPFGLGGTVTAGIVSARHRDINSGPYDDFIQTDASINRGNSGGPMFNLDGEVIGVNTAIFSPSGGSVGIGFAIPSNLAKPIIDQLRKFGRARRGWLGVRIQTVTDEIAQSLELDKTSGALVADLTGGGPAEKGKILVGDVILTFDGKDVDEMRSLPRIVAETAVGETVVVEVWRQGAKVKLNIVLGEFPDDERLVASRSEPQKPEAEKDLAVLGLTLSAVTPELRTRFKLDDDVEGVIVTKVEEGSAAATRQIRPGDIIRKVGHEHVPVKRPSQVKKLVDDARKANRKTIIVLVEREGGRRFVPIKIDKG